VDDRRIPASGDPFHAAGQAKDAEASEPLHCCCWRGFVYVGHLVVAEDGEEVEVFEAVPCKRCKATLREGEENRTCQS
jgi:hypothetical protein